jgi:hypothetical protein
MPFAVDGFLNGVAATSARNVWAVGGNGAGRNLILHWDGTAWKRVPARTRQARRASWPEWPPCPLPMPGRSAA